ncbi:hypothetical protein J6590_046873 [Homalodisca vitripennis]|nr:hypothetical protein J6590_046873 [Homalodisca vitripennis]
MDITERLVSETAIKHNVTSGRREHNHGCGGQTAGVVVVKCRSLHFRVTKVIAAAIQHCSLQKFGLNLATGPNKKFDDMYRGSTP